MRGVCSGEQALQARNREELHVSPPGLGLGLPHPDVFWYSFGGPFYLRFPEAVILSDTRRALDRLSGTASESNDYEVSYDGIAYSPTNTIGLGMEY